MFNGGVASLVALAEKEIEEQRKKGFEPNVFITGGDASLLMICWLIQVEN